MDRSLRRIWRRVSSGVLEFLPNRRIQSRYERLLRYARRAGVNPDLSAQLQDWQQGKWKSYQLDVLGRIPISISGKTVVDFGCKYGLLAPLLLELGASRVIGIEQMDAVIATARELFKAEGDKVKFVTSEAGYIPLQPETVDLVIVNEVVSHIHATYLPTVYAEIARILVPGGMLFISDGNNLGYREYVEERLIPLYDAIENGPDGTTVGEVTVQVCLLNQRKNYIRARHPQMAEEQVRYLAENTSGLFGEYFGKVIDRFARTGELIRRPYRRGTAPTYPDSGQVEERGFYPEQVTYDLREYGFKCEILDRPARPPVSARRVALDPAAMRPSADYAEHAYEIAIPPEYAGEPQYAGDPPYAGGHPALLLEDNKPLSFQRAPRADIGTRGLGRYDIWRERNVIYLSSSDNSDPRVNGRLYELYWTNAPEDGPGYGNPNFQIIALKTS